MDNQTEELYKIKTELAVMNKSLDEIVRDLKYHIRRTDMLEQKTNRITYMLLLGAGASMPSFIPSILKLLGL